MRPHREHSDSQPHELSTRMDQFSKKRVPRRGTATANNTRFQPRVAFRKMRPPSNPQRQPARHVNDHGGILKNEHPSRTQHRHQHTLLTRVHRAHSDRQQHTLSAQGPFWKMRPPSPHSDSQPHMLLTRGQLNHGPPSSPQRQPPTHAFNQEGCFEKWLPVEHTLRQPTTHASSSSAQRQPPRMLSTRGAILKKASHVDPIATANNTRFQPKGIF